MPAGERLLLAAADRLATAAESLESHSPGHVFVAGAKEAGRDGTQVVKDQFRSNPDHRRELFRDQL
jgi:hypothetical protein